MNTERKVKTVRFNSHPAHFMAKMFNDGEIIEVLDTQWVQGAEESAYVFFNDKQGRRHGAYAGFGNNYVLEIVELHQEPKNLFDQPQYATIADVERMVREAMGKGEKVAYKENVIKDVGGNLEDWRSFELWEQDGCYWALDEDLLCPITNFAMKMVYYLSRSKRETYQIAHIKNVFGQECNIEFDVNDFLSKEEFQKRILKHGHFLFKGTDIHLENLHRKLMYDLTNRFIKTPKQP